MDLARLLAGAGLAAVADRPAATLDHGNQRRLELAAPPHSPCLPTPRRADFGAGSNAESLSMVERIRETAVLVCAGVLVIEHDLAFITRLSHRVVVLAEGRPLVEGTPVEVRGDPAVASPTSFGGVSGSGDRDLGGGHDARDERRGSYDAHRSSRPPEDVTSARIAA